MCNRNPGDSLCLSKVRGLVGRDGRMCPKMHLQRRRTCCTALTSSTIPDNSTDSATTRMNFCFFKFAVLRIFFRGNLDDANLSAAHNGRIFLFGFPDSRRTLYSPQSFFHFSFVIFWQILFAVRSTITEILNSPTNYEISKCTREKFTLIWKKRKRKRNKMLSRYIEKKKRFSRLYMYRTNSRKTDLWAISSATENSKR